MYTSNKYQIRWVITLEITINGRFLTQKVTGVQRFALETLKRMDEEIGFNITVLVPKDYNSNYVFKRVNIKKVGVLTGHAWEQIELPRYTKNETLINLCNTAPISKKNQIVVVHDMAVFSAPNGFSKLFRTWYKTMFKFFKMKSCSLLTVSEFSKSEIIKHLGVIESKVNVIKEGTEHFSVIREDNKTLEKYDLKPQNYVLAVSSMNPNKNFSVLLDSLQHINGEEFDIVLAGGSNSKVFNSVNLNDSKIKQVGYVTDEELKSLYMNAGCFVFPSIYEGFGLPPIEAMSVGCPVIASNIAPLNEILGDAALFFDPNDSEQLADEIKKVMSNVNVRGALRNKGLEQSDKYSWKITSSQILSSVIHLEKGIKKSAS